MMNMSERAVAQSPSPSGEGRKEGLPFAAFGASTGFRSDTRYAAAPSSAPQPEGEPEDPLGVAWAEGYAAGAEQAQAEAAQQARIEAEARTALKLNFAKLDRELEDLLRQRLRDTVAALCEAALAPLALDESALAGRIERAVALFARADDERVIRLHPDDIALVSPRLAEDWQVVPDPSLDRGALRVESASGGVEDGPAEWRAAIAEALHQC
jgi:flagellar assembly protein FliH